MRNNIHAIVRPLAGLSAVLMMSAAGVAYAADLPDAVAPAEVADMHEASGVVGLYGAYTRSSEEGDDDGDGDGWMFGGEAKANVWLAPSYSVQLDLRGEAGEFDSDNDEDEGRGNATVGGHLTWRNPDMYALGVFGGFSGGTILDDEGFETRYFVGIEGQYYWNDFTFYAQGGFSDLVRAGDEEHAEMAETWFGRAVGRWFFTPYDKIEGEFGITHARDLYDSSPSGPVNTYNWGALYEHQYMNSAFSSYIEYDGLKRDDDLHNNDTVTEHIFMVGVRINLNQPDLKTADRYGATLDLPDLIRTEAWADIAH